MPRAPVPPIQCDARVGLCDEELKSENTELRALIDECRDSIRILKVFSSLLLPTHSRHVLLSLCAPTLAIAISYRTSSVSSPPQFLASNCQLYPYLRKSGAFVPECVGRSTEVCVRMRPFCWCC